MPVIVGQSIPLTPEERAKIKLREERALDISIRGFPLTKIHPRFTGYHLKRDLNGFVHQNRRPITQPALWSQQGISHNAKQKLR